MDVKLLKRDADSVLKTLKKTPDGKVITLKGCVIHIPSRYLDKELAYLDENVYILGVYAIIVDGVYAVSKTLSMMKIKPVETRQVMIDDVEYFEFEFLPGSVVIDNINVVIKDTLVYNVYDFFIDSGLIPWFMSYIDIGTLFHNTEHDNNVKLGANRAVTEMLAASIARDEKDRTRYFRQTIKDVTKSNVAYVPFKSVVFGPKTTTAKLMGSYFDQGLVSALVHPNDRPEQIETLLRK